MAGKIIIAGIDNYEVAHENGTLTLTRNCAPITITNIENYDIALENGGLILMQKRLAVPPPTQASNEPASDSENEDDDSYEPPSDMEEEEEDEYEPPAKRAKNTNEVVPSQQNKYVNRLNRCYWRAAIAKNPIFKINLNNSRLKMAKLGDNKPIYNIQYSRFLTYLYSKFDKNVILQYTTLNMSETKIVKCSTYNAQLGMYIHHIYSGYILKEIIHIAKQCNVSLQLEIQLKNGEVVNFAM